MSPSDDASSHSISNSRPDMTGKRILVMGGTSGIGKACALLFASYGATVFVGGRNAERLEKTLTEIHNLGAKGSGVCADVGSIEGIRTFFAAADEFLGSLDISILNAGLPSKGELADMTHEECLEVVSVNLLSYIWGSLESMRRLKTKGGHIVMTGSMSADVFDTRASVYVATKSGVRGFASSLRKEANPLGVKISVVEPGTVSSGMVDETAEEQETMIREKRMLRSEDVAEAILFMLQQPPWSDVIELKLRPHLQLI